MRKGAAGLHVAGGDEQNGVAVDHVAVAVAEQSAVGIAVQSDAKIELAATAPHLGGHVLGMERAAAVVDVASVGRGVQGFGGDADAGEKARRPRRWRLRWRNR